MALTKAKVKEILSKAGVESDSMDAAVESIMTGHIASIDALREERDGYKADAEKLPDIQKELDEAKKANEGAGESEKKYNDLKKSYDDLKKEYEGYKSDQSAKAEKAKKDKAYRAMLKEVGVSEKRVDAIMKVTDLSEVKLDKDGAIEGVEELKESMKTEWADFITTEGKQGAGTPNPPAGKTDPPKGKSRAAEIEAKYHSDLYGEVKSNE